MCSKIGLSERTQSLYYLKLLIKKYNPLGNRVYDIEIVSIMLANNIKTIATANIVDFKNIEEITILEVIS